MKKIKIIFIFIILLIFLINIYPINQAQNNFRHIKDKILFNNFPINNFTLTINIIGEGIVEKFPDNETFKPGTRVQLNATPNENWIFENWSGDASGEQNITWVYMDSNKTVNATFRFIPNILTININVLPWNRLEVIFNPYKDDIYGWRDKEQEIKIEWIVNNPYNSLENANFYIRLREWMLDSAFPKFLFFLTESGNIFLNQEESEILGIKFYKMIIPIDEGINYGYDIIPINLWDQHDCQIGGFGLIIDNRIPHFWNYDWTSNNICF
jgi:hypothetical protein